LKPYEELILAAGGQKINAASFIILARAAPDETLTLWRQKFNSFRLQGYFIDVIFEDGVGGEHGAHRLILGCFGDHFTDMLCKSGMKEARGNGDGPSTGDVVRIPAEDYDGDAIQTALGAYTLP